MTITENKEINFFWNFIQQNFQNFVHTNWWQRHRHYFWYTDNIYFPWIFLFLFFFLHFLYAWIFCWRKKFWIRKKAWRNLPKNNFILKFSLFKTHWKKQCRFIISMKGSYVQLKMCTISPVFVALLRYYI
jgi:hypothetical protein